MESDLKCRKIDQSDYLRFAAQHDKIEEFVQKLALSKEAIESKRIKIWHDQIELEPEYHTIACESTNDLVKLYEVFGCFEGVQRHMIKEEEEHIRKVIDFTINVKLIERFNVLLNKNEFLLSLQ